MELLGRVAGMTDALHIDGVVLPDGERRDLWISNGTIGSEPIPGAESIDGEVWVIPGLVDAHCHVGLGPDGAVSDEVAAQQAQEDLMSGTMLIRDAGSASDTRWLQSRAEQPRLIRAGRHIARPKRYIRNLAAEVEPAELVAEVRRQARAGDGWVKLVGDWIDRSAGDLTPLWPADVAAEAIAAAHEEGARVTAHCFAEQSVAELVGAGIDCIEHGTGMSDEVIDEMVRRGTALVPTLINLDRFPIYAAPAEERYPTYFQHMHHLYDRRHETIGKAIEAGITVFSGTDAGTVVRHGRVRDEIDEIAKLAGNEYALGASSWNARRWLGGETITDGASADLIVLDADPRVDLSTLRRPVALVLKGRRVA